MLLSLGVLGWSAAAATQIEPLPDPRANGFNPSTAPSPATRSIGEADDQHVDAAVEANPFSASRRSPAVRFTLAAPAEDGPAMHDAHIDAAPRPELIGVAHVGSDAFVLVSYPGQESRLVRRGEGIGGWKLVSVGEGAAVFASEAGVQLELEMPPP